MMDSKETTVEEQTSDVETQEQPQFIEIDGEKISIEEATKGYLRQKDYTKKTTELARQREELEKMKQQPVDVSADEKAVDEFLKGKGYLTKEDAQQLLTQAQQEQLMDRFFDNNPELSKHEDAIRAIAKVDNSALEDIVVKYNFTTSDKVQKAKSSRTIVGDSKKEQQKQKTVKEMTPAEYAKWKTEQGISGNRGTFSD